MNVGQVEFQVKASGLKDTLELAERLQSTLNGIDGKNVGAGGVSRRNKEENAYNRAVQRSLRNGKQLIAQTKTSARIWHQDSERRIKFEQKFQKQERDRREWVAKKEREIAKEEEKANDEEIKQNVKRQNMKIKMRQETARRVAGILKDQAKEEQAAAEEAAKAPYEFQRKWQTALVNTGAQMQTLGATIQRFTSPFTNVYRGLTMGIGYRLLGKAMDSINGAFSRYDTIETYGKVLNNLGLDATKKFSVAGEKAKDVYHNLENAVLGLPTGIDEIIASMRRYVGATGDVEKATKLAIAANNAYIAGYMGEREKLFTERQLVALAGGAELSTNQWDSLRRNAPLAMKVVSKSMKMSVQEMVDALKQGTISGQEFLDVFIKAGTEGKLKDAAQVMKQTWDAVSQNVQNRMNAMGEGILKALDSVFEKMDGRSFLQHVLGVDKNGNFIGGGIRGVIDDMSDSVQKWIKANPEKITGFFDSISHINWKSIASGFGQFALSMGRFYAFLGKIFGNGNLIRAMLDFNLAGKAIQTAGGFIKGTAGITSWMLTFAKFHGVNKAVKNGAALAKGHGAIVGATRTIGTAALSWQQVASKGLSIAAIPAMAWALKEVALGLQELDKVNLSWGLAGKIAAAGGAITAFGAVATAMGALITNAVSIPVLGQITAAGTIAGIGSMAGIAKAMKWVGEGLNSIADAKIPSMEKLDSTMRSMQEVEKFFGSKNIFEALGTIFDSWTKTSEFKAVEKMSRAFDSIAKIAEMKMPKDWKRKAKGRFAGLKSFIDGLEEFFVYVDKNKEKGAGATNGANYRGNKTRYSTWSHEVASFASIIENVNGAFTSMDSVLTNAPKLYAKYTKMQEAIKLARRTGDKNVFSWSNLKTSMMSMVDGIYGLLGKQTNGRGYQVGKTMMQKLQEVSTSFEAVDMQNIVNQVGKIPSLIKKLQQINNILALDARKSINQSGNTGFSNIYDLLKPVFDELAKIKDLIPDDVSGFKGLGVVNKALDKVKTTVNKLGELSHLDTSGIDLSGIENLKTTIDTAMSKLDEIGKKEVTISIKLIEEITGGDDVVDAVKKEIDRVKKKIDGLPASIEKNIYAHLSSGAVTGGWDLYYKVKSKIDEIRRKIMGLGGDLGEVGISAGVGSGAGGGGGGGWAGGHPDKHNGGKIHPLYRAHGGSIFMSRGTDTVPTMLTPGEFVINRMAASRIGDAALWKLNHMDIAGALRSLSAKAGQSIVPRGNVVNNTTNNTRNATVNLNNYNNGSMGIARASRWAKSL